VRFQPSIFGRSSRLHAKRYICGWSVLADETARLERHIDEGKLVALPFVLIAAATQRRRQLAAAQMYVRDKLSGRGSRGGGDRRSTLTTKFALDICAAEFREHATAYLTAGLFECHDRNAFEIHAIAPDQTTAAPIGKRLEKHSTSYRRIGRTDRDIAEEIRRAEIDILVNLNGYVGDDRTGCTPSGPRRYRGTIWVTRPRWVRPSSDYIVCR